MIKKKSTKTANIKKSLEERVLKQTGYIGVATIRALSLAQCAAKKKKRFKKLKKKKKKTKKKNIILTCIPTF